MPAGFRTTDYHTAFARYEAVRHRLPEAGTPRVTHRAANLAEIADHFDALLLDAFGVLNIGEAPVPGAPERLAELRSLGKELRVLTNAASVPVEDLLAKYHRLGFDFTLEEVVSSRQVLIAAATKAPARHWGVILPEGSDTDDLTDLDHRLLTTDPADYDAVEGFLFLGSKGWSPEHQEILTRSLAKAPRPFWVGNPDLVAPRETGFSVEPGFFAHDIADSLSIAPAFFGKPFDNAFDMALATLPPEIPRNRVFMVGDSPHTDILGGNAAGLKSVLLTPYGFLTGQDVEQVLEQCEIRPDYQLAAI